jgi:hypothetical protein
VEGLSREREHRTMYVRKLAVKAADGFGESREGLYKSEVGKKLSPYNHEFEGTLVTEESEAVGGRRSYLMRKAVCLYCAPSLLPIVFKDSSSTARPDPRYAVRSSRGDYADHTDIWGLCQSPSMS